MATFTPVRTATADVADEGPAHGVSPLLAWMGLGILLLLAFVAFLDRQIISLMVGMIKADLGITDGHIGILQGAAFGLVYPLFALPLGYAADRYSRRWVIFLGVIFWSVAAVGSGLAGSFNTLLAARIGVGIGEAALQPAAASLLSDIFPKKRLATVFSIFATGSLLGSAGALAIGGAVITWAGDGMAFPLVGHLEPWQVAFVVTGLPAAFVAILVFLIPEPKRPAYAVAQGGGSAAWREVFGFMRQNWRFLTCYLGGFSCLLLVTWGGLAWMPAILERTYGWTIAQVGASLGLFTVLMGLPGQMTNGLVVDRIFAKHNDAHLRYYAFACVLITLCGVLAPFSPSAWIYLVLLGPAKFLLNYGGVQIATLQVVTPAAIRGRMTAVAGIVSSVLGGTFGPSIVAFFTDHVFRDDNKVAWSLGATYAIFVPLAGLLFWLGMKPMRAAVLRSEP